MASKEDTLVQALSSSLTEQQTQKVIHTTPPGFDKAIRSLPRADRVSSAFQAAGIWAWISYFLVASHNDEIEESLSQLPEPTLQYVISEVSKVKASPSLITRIQHTLYHSHRAATRRRLLQASGIKLPEHLQPSSASDPFSLSPHPNVPSSPPGSTRRSPSPEPNPSKRPRLEPSQEDIESDTVGDLPPCPMGADASPGDCVSDITLRRCDEICELPTFCPTLRVEAAYPKARYIPLIFPHDMCRAICKRGVEASLMLSLPTDPRSSRLVLDMCASDVIHFARELFGVRIGVENKRRVLVLQDGMVVEVPCGLKLIESNPLTWAPTFGQIVNDAMAHCQMRQDEIKIGALLLSRCLCMEIPIAEESPARLCLMMQPEKLSAIFGQLWQD